MNLKKIKKILTFSSILIFFLFLNVSYANSQGQGTAVFWNLLVSIFDLISSIWYVLPIIAWKLLTNDLLYWVSLHLDTLLWNIWNFSRSIANFLIWFLFIYFIFKFITSEKDVSLIKTNLPKIAFWSIIINASWFIIAVLIDISTVLIAWFGSLSLNFSSLNKTTKIAVPTNITFDSTKCSTKNNACFNWSYSIVATWDNKLTLDKLQSYETYISWPLFFMWSNILGINISKENLLNKAYDVNSREFKHNWTAITAIIQIIIILLFTIPIIVLIVVNVVRVFWIWIYIWFSPLIFLDQIFWWKVASKEKAFWFKNMIWLIFQPALVVLAFSISSIFITVLYSTLVKAKVWKTDYTNNVKKVFLLDKSANWIVDIEWFWKIQDASSKTEFIWWFFSYLIVSILIIILLWTLIRLSFKATEVTSSISKSMFDFSTELMKTAKFIPTPYAAQSIWSMKYLWQNVNRLPSNLFGKQADKLAEKFKITPDIMKTKADNIINNINSSNSKSKREWFKIAMEKLEVFKDKWIDTKKNAKELINAIEKSIIPTIIHKTSIEEKLNKAQTYEDKLNILLKNQTTIENDLWITH